MREDMGITVAWTSAKLPATRHPFLERLTAPLRHLIRSTARPQTRLLRHVETLSLGQKKSLYLVECAGERFLISAGSESLSAPVPLQRNTPSQTSVEDRP